MSDLLQAERRGWEELHQLVSSLSPDERLTPGYFEEGWSVKDLWAHIGTWRAEAGVLLTQIRLGTFASPPRDVDAMNERFLAAMQDQPWEVVDAQAHSARHRFLHEWRLLDDKPPVAMEWFNKAGPEHYDEHLPRLRDWVAELQARR